MSAQPHVLPELAALPWRARVDARCLRRADRLWTLCTFAHSVPFFATALLLAILKPITIPVGVILVAHAWIIPELYAARGANVVRDPGSRRHPTQQRADLTPHAPEANALLLLGDLVNHEARDLYVRTGLVLERGELGTWLLGPAGGLLVRAGGRRVNCYCVKATGADLPRADRVAHLLLALRSDEAGFTTVANLAFSGACWRLSRRMRPGARLALAAARQTEALRGLDPVSAAVRPVVA